jgi:uncharacterized protein YunC (DUF1805 family)
VSDAKLVAVSTAGTRAGITAGMTGAELLERIR